MKELFFMMGSETGGTERQLDELEFRAMWKRASEFHMFIGVHGDKVVKARRELRPGAKAPRKSGKLTAADARGLLRLIRTKESLTPTDLYTESLDLRPDPNKEGAIVGRERLKNAVISTIIRAENRFEASRAEVDSSLAVGVWESFQQGEPDRITGQSRYRFLPGRAAELGGYEPVAMSWCVLWAENELLPSYEAAPDPKEVQLGRIWLNILDCVVNHQSKELVIVAHFNRGNRPSRGAKIDGLQVVVAEGAREMAGFLAQDSAARGARYTAAGVDTVRKPLRGVPIEPVQWATFAFDFADRWPAVTANHAGTPIRRVILQVAAGGQEFKSVELAVRHHNE